MTFYVSEPRIGAQPIGDTDTVKITLLALS